MKKIAGIRGNKGFTLIELLVALLISGMLLATVSSVFLMSQKIYTRGENTSFKQKSITNVETDLQNALSRATSVSLKINPPEIKPPAIIAKDYYSLGFNAQGQCVETFYTNKKNEAGNFVGTENSYIADQISEIALKALANAGVYTMSYELVPKKDSGMSTLKGGTVLNNSKNFDLSVLKSKFFTDVNPIVLNIDAQLPYLVIEYDPTGS